MADEERAKGTDTTRRDDRAGTRRNSQKDNIFDEQTRIRRDSSIVERPRDRGNVLSVAKRRGDWFIVDVTFYL